MSIRIFFTITIFIVCLSSLCEAYQEEREFAELNKRYCRIRKHCTRYEESDYEYRNLTKISNIHYGKQEGYVVRLAFYALADRDAHIIFTTNDLPNFQTDFAYEILIGGWGNLRTLIRRKRQAEDRAIVDTPVILTKRAPLKVLIDIKTDGEIQVFIEHEKNPIAIWKDPEPLPIQYFGFASYDNSLAQYFYNCRGEEPRTIDELRKACKRTVTNDFVFNEFIPIPRDAPEGYQVSFTVHIKGDKDAHILLSPNQTSEGDVYDILVGGWGNRKVIVRRRKTEALLIEVNYDDDILPKNQIFTVLIRLTLGGEINVYGKQDHTQYKKLASILDIWPLAVHYISFASENAESVEYLYNCSIPPPPFDGIVTVHLQTNHSLLNDPELPLNYDKRNFLITKCSHSTHNKYEYKNFVPLSRLHDSRPYGYIARFAIYAQGERDAHILLSNNKEPHQGDDVYEFLIGGWANNKILIRRKISDAVLAEVNVAKAITKERPTKIVIEITLKGHIRVYTEANKNRPIASAIDPNPLDVNYISFASFEGEELQFFYNCLF